MAITTYITPIIAAPNLPAKKQIAYSKLQELIQHIMAGTGGYTMDLISADFSVTNAQRITVVLTDPLPNQLQIDRYNLTQVV